MIDYKRVNSYIGKPWVYLEFDCWALVKKASLEIFGVEINEHISFSSSPDLKSNINTFNERKESGSWLKVESPSPGDVVLFYDRKNNPIHIGLYIEKNNVLHCMGGTGVKNGKSRYDSLNMIKLIHPRYEFYKYANNGS
jgi:cell wall-associated NlpC family hydrolase